MMFLKLAIAFFVGALFGISLSSLVLKHKTSQTDIDLLARAAVEDLEKTYANIRRDKEIENAFQDQFSSCLKTNNELHHRVFDLEKIVDSRKCKR